MFKNRAIKKIGTFWIIKWKTKKRRSMLVERKKEETIYLTKERKKEKTKERRKENFY